jgi:hypothetical protein
MRRRKPPSVPACPRCGNEEDLREWYDGNVYCQSCITCPHGREGVRGGVCANCVRRLYTVMTFEGPRIANVGLYVHEAWREYSLEPSSLLTWKFEEQEQLSTEIMAWEIDQKILKDIDPAHVRSFGVTAPPPHHRFTSSDGSR